MHTRYHYLQTTPDSYGVLFNFLHFCRCKEQITIWICLFFFPYFRLNHQVDKPVITVTKGVGRPSSKLFP